ncbi:MAG: glycosyl transferase, partial [Lachnospiraceae bacterium]
MKFGYFDDANKEYVITTPKTPLPWINYLGCNEFFSLISNTCGGYSFYKDAKLLRLTRYRYNDVPYDINGKYFYIKDGDAVWNPGWQPTRTDLDSYECRHGIGYSRFTSAKNGLKASVLAFVPINDRCEINQLVLTNESSSEKSFKVFSYVEWCLWNADDDSRNFQRNFSTGEVEVIGSTIYHKTEYRERRNHYAVYSVNAPIDGFDTIRENFLGAYRGADTPIVVENGEATNSMCSGWQPIASHQINVTLKPGESKSFVFVLGYCENPEDQKWESKGVINKTPANELLSRYRTDADVARAFNEL